MDRSRNSTFVRSLLDGQVHTSGIVQFDRMTIYCQDCAGTAEQLVERKQPNLPSHLDVRGKAALGVQDSGVTTVSYMTKELARWLTFSPGMKADWRSCIASRSSPQYLNRALPTEYTSGFRDQASWIVSISFSAPAVPVAPWGGGDMQGGSGVGSRESGILDTDISISVDLGPTLMQA